MLFKPVFDANIKTDIDKLQIKNYRFNFFIDRKKVCGMILFRYDNATRLIHHNTSLTLALEHIKVINKL